MTDPLVEAVARAIYEALPFGESDLPSDCVEAAACAAIAAIREAEPTCGHTRASVRLVDGAPVVCQDCGETVGKYDAWGRDVAEPLTSTPESSTTETDGEAAISQDPPPGFEWEYRMRHADRPGNWSTWVTHEPLPTRGWLVERRLVGKPERMED